MRDLSGSSREPIRIVFLNNAIMQARRHSPSLREADVAIRFVYENQNLPEHLYGRRLVSVHRAVYVSRRRMNSQRQVDGSKMPIAWITKEEDGPIPKWALQCGGPTKGPIYLVSDILTQLAATREGLGASILHCYIGDKDPDLERLAPGETRLYGELWILTHGDIRNTPRVRAFTEFIAEAIRAHADVLEGKN